MSWTIVMATNSNMNCVKLEIQFCSNNGFVTRKTFLFRKFAFTSFHSNKTTIFQKNFESIIHLSGTKDTEPAFLCSKSTIVVYNMGVLKHFSPRGIEKFCPRGISTFWAWGYLNIFGLKNQTRKIDKIPKDFELYHIFMY